MFFKSTTSSTVTLDLSIGGTFARALEASYYTAAPTDGSTSFLSWASSGTRRVENRGDGKGNCLLMEKSAVNCIVQSRDMGNAAWSVGTATLTNNANSGTDGLLLADRENAASGQYSAYSTNLTQSTQVAASVWARAVAGTVSHQMLVFDIGPLSASVANVTTTYSRRNFTYVFGIFAGAFLPLDGRDQTSVGGQVATAQDVYFDLPQLERGYYPTSAIRTTTTPLIRPSDTLSYTTGNYPAAILTSGAVIVFAPDASSSEIVSSAEDWRLIQVADNDYVRIRNASGACKAELVCGASVVAALTITFSRAQTLTITAKPSAGSITVSGATTGDGTNTGTGAAWASGQTLHIGGDYLGNNNATGRFVGASIAVAA